MSRRSVPRRVLGAVLSWGLVVLLVRVVVALPEHCPVVDRDDLIASAFDAVGWLERNQNPDGTWLYRYDAAADEVIDDYNTVRHAGVTMSLYQAHTAGIEGALEVGDRGLEYAVANLVRHDDWVAFEPRSTRVTTGAAALLVAGLVERRLATGDDRHDELMAALSRFLLVHVEPSGAVAESWDRRSERPRFGLYSPFFTGEVYWALASMHLVFPGQGWDEPAARIGHYLATERDAAEGYFPDLPDHWAAYGMWVTAMWPDHDTPTRPMSDAQVAYVERQAGLGSIQTRWESQRVDDVPRHLLRGRRTLGAGLGTVGEQLTGLWQVAVADERLGHLVEPLAERAVCVAGMVVDRQVTEAEAQEHYPDPGRARGAWFQFDITQMDDQQHALSAVLLTLPILDRSEELP
jgi:hypothetical protein